MTLLNLEKSPKTYARTAGAMYLLIAICGGFSIGYVPSVLLVSGDALKTAGNIDAHQGLYRLGIFADVIVVFAEIILTAMLYHLLKPVNKTLSMIAAFARLSMVLVMAINILIYIIPLALINGIPLSDTFTPAQTQTIALALLEIHQYGIYIWGILFGLHLIALGYLVINAGYFPKILGWAMMIGSFGYIAEGVAAVTFTENALLSMLIIGLLVLVTIGELSFAVYLLIKGMNITVWKNRMENTQ